MFMSLLNPQHVVDLEILYVLGSFYFVEDRRLWNRR